MSVNQYKPHLLVRPEDDANRQIANGFILEIPEKNIRRIQVLPVASGWRKVVDQFLEEDVPGLERFDRSFSSC